uniref:Uncharacterized protein n=1 Tax=Solanum lycopersicum TaxID=4081 RepID=A0A3Q7ELX3_SOLLC
MEFGFNSIIAPLFSPIRVTNLLDFSFILEFPAASFPARRNRGFVSGCNFGGDSFHGLTEEEAIGRNAGDVGDEESIDLAGETGAVDGVGDFGAGKNARIGVAGGGGDVAAGGRMVGRG